MPSYCERVSVVEFFGCLAPQAASVGYWVVLCLCHTYLSMPAGQAFALYGLTVDGGAAANAALDGCGLLALGLLGVHGLLKRKSPLGAGSWW